MEFTRTYRHRELAAAAKLFSVFRAVEERQLRRLFAHLKDREYERLLAAIRRGGLAGFSPGDRYLTVPGTGPDPDSIRDSILVFRGFCHLRSRVEDFCGSDPPSLLTFSFEGKDYDLIPGTAANVAAINAQADLASPETTRFIVTETPDAVPGLALRPAGDYLIAAAGDGSCTIYQQ